MEITVTNIACWWNDISNYNIETRHRSNHSAGGTDEDCENVNALFNSTIRVEFLVCFENIPPVNEYEAAEGRINRTCKGI